MNTLNLARYDEPCSNVGNQFEFGSLPSRGNQATMAEARDARGGRSNHKPQPRAGKPGRKDRNASDDSQVEFGGVEPSGGAGVHLNEAHVHCFKNHGMCMTSG